MQHEQADQGTYRVVMNDEGQYSILPERQPLPAGWRNAGFEGDSARCLAHVGEVWTDMRPMAARRVR